MDSIPDISDLPVGRLLAMAEDPDYAGMVDDIRAELETRDGPAFGPQPGESGGFDGMSHDTSELDGPRPEPRRPAPPPAKPQGPLLQTCGHPVGDLRQSGKGGKTTTCASCDALSKALKRHLGDLTTDDGAAILKALRGWRPGPGSKGWLGD